MIPARFSSKGGDHRPRQTEWRRTRNHGDVLPMTEPRVWWKWRWLL